MQYWEIRGPTDPRFSAEAALCFTDSGQLTPAGQKWQEDTRRWVQQHVADGRRRDVRRTVTLGLLFVTASVWTFLQPPGIPDERALNGTFTLFWGALAMGALWRWASRRRARQHERLKAKQAAELEWARTWAGMTPDEQKRARQVQLAGDVAKGIGKLAWKATGIAGDLSGR